MNNATLATIDPTMLKIAATIDRYGINIVHVGGGCDCADCRPAPMPVDQQFGYTIGLTDRGHPELLLRGLGSRATAATLNRWGAVVLDGETFDAGHLLCEGPRGTTWELVPVRRPSRILRCAASYYRTAGAGRATRPDGVSALELIPARRPCACGSCS